MITAIFLDFLMIRCFISFLVIITEKHVLNDQILMAFRKNETTTRQDVACVGTPGYSPGFPHYDISVPHMPPNGRDTAC